MSFHDFKMTRIDGTGQSLKDYAGQVCLVVNVASRCGLTPQYSGLQSLYAEYRDRGFVILGFPANEFGAQEPGSDSEIQAFCQTQYQVEFPMFSKIVVHGPDTHPLYRWLLESGPRSDDIEWNFAKFLIGKDGQVVARFSPQTAPSDPALRSAIDQALAA